MQLLWGEGGRAIGEKEGGELTSPLSFGLELTELICPESGSLSVR